MDGIAKAKDRGAKFGRKRELTDEKAKEIRTLRESGDHRVGHYQADKGKRLSSSGDVVR